ncbi:MAG: hypothetical protein N2Z21_08405 [Candidatus Sumerlaeaceae bacterium]|nr:hypothetical protein [Candidatus Sumerlaeaceae bacterium]
MGLRRSSWVFVGLAILGLCLVGCKQRVKIKEKVLGEEETVAVKESVEKPHLEPTATPRPTRRPQARIVKTPLPAPSPTPTPAIDYTPIVVDASAMWTDKATSDPAGGKKLSRNGFLQVDNVQVPYPIAEVVLEMKGTHLGNVWPEVDLNMFNRTEKKNFFPWPRDYVTTSSFHLFVKKVDPPMPPGTYLITFRYYNDSPSDNPEEDRAVTLKRIELRP